MAAPRAGAVLAAGGENWSLIEESALAKGRQTRQIDYLGDADGLRPACIPAYSRCHNLFYWIRDNAFILPENAFSMSGME